MENQNSSSENYDFVSKATTKPFTYRWRVEQFPSRLENADDRLFSSKFEVGIDRVPMFMGLQRFEDAEKDDQELFCAFLCNASNVKTVKLDYSITLVNSQPENSVTKKDPEPRIFEHFHRGWGVKFLPYADVIDKERGFLAADNSLTVLFEGVAIIDDRQGEIDALQFDLALSDGLGNDLRKLFESGIFSDFVVKANNADGQKKELKVHRCILAARSDFFAAMFSNPDLKECREGMVEIEDIGFEVMEALIRFLYSGKIPTQSDSESEEINSQLELLVASDKYQVLGLKNHLEQVLAAKLSVENVCGCFVIAKRHSAPFLAARCREFIRSKATELAKTDVWRQFCAENAELVADLITIQ